MAMAAFEELDFARTPLGDLILRRREVLSLDRAEVFEVRLDGQFLMSSMVNDAEIALADLALPLVDGELRDILVGGLGLGYTAHAALVHDNIASVTVVELLRPVISWHERALVPLGRVLTQDVRCQLVHGDFFTVVGSPGAGADGRSHLAHDIAARRFHAILLDIDHSPQCLLHSDHGAFYTTDGLTQLTHHLHPGGVFALWSADSPEPALTDQLNDAFATVAVHESRFFNPLLDLDDVNYIVIGQIE